MSILEFAQRFVDALEARDVDRARDFFHPDAGIWHNFDRTTQTVDQNMASLKFMIASTQSMKYNITRLEEIKGGYLQQHQLAVVSNKGEELTTDAIAIVHVEDGKIKHIEEYIDPSPLAPLRG